MNKNTRSFWLQLTEDDLVFLSDVFHEYKDCYRCERENVLPAMAIESKLKEQTDGFYEPDTTYDIKDN